MIFGYKTTLSEFENVATLRQAEMLFIFVESPLSRVQCCALCNSVRAPTSTCLPCDASNRKDKKSGYWVLNS